MLFMDADASKEEEGAARVVDHARARAVAVRIRLPPPRSGVATATRWRQARIWARLFFYFLKFNFWCRLVTADTKNRLFFISHS
jgi:hypothetical protein